MTTTYASFGWWIAHEIRASHRTTLVYKPPDHDPGLWSTAVREVCGVLGETLPEDHDQNSSVDPKVVVVRVRTTPREGAWTTATLKQQCWTYHQRNEESYLMFTRWILTNSVTVPGLTEVYQLVFQHGVVKLSSKLAAEFLVSDDFRSFDALDFTGMTWGEVQALVDSSGDPSHSWSTEKGHPLEKCPGRDIRMPVNGRSVCLPLDWTSVVEVCTQEGGTVSRVAMIHLVHPDTGLLRNPMLIEDYLFVCGIEGHVLTCQEFLRWAEHCHAGHDSQLLSALDRYRKASFSDLPDLVRYEKRIQALESLILDRGLKEDQLATLDRPWL